MIQLGGGGGGAKVLKCGLYLYPLFVYMGSDSLASLPAHMHMLAGAFIAKHCDKYQKQPI